MDRVPQSHINASHTSYHVPPDPLCTCAAPCGTIFSLGVKPWSFTRSDSLPLLPNPSLLPCLPVYWLSSIPGHLAQPGSPARCLQPQPCFSPSLVSHLFPWVPTSLSPAPSFCFLCLNSSSICSYHFRIPYLNMLGVALFPSYFMDAVRGTFLIVPVELSMKLMPLVPVGSREECRERGVDFRNILPTPVVLTHFFGGRGDSFVLFSYKPLLYPWGCF